MDRKAGRAVFALLGRNHDHAAPVFLARSLHEGVARDLPGAALRQIDHVIGAIAGAVVEAVAGDGDARRAGLEIMAAIALIEAGANGELVA